jgi:hypothetical protein
LAVLAGVGYAFALPTRTYLAQERSIAAERHAVAVLQSEDSRLSAQVKSLHTNATIEQLARQEFGLVFQGQQAYAVLPAPPAPQPKTSPRPPERPAWYSHLEFWRYF